MDLIKEELVQKVEDNRDREEYRKVVRNGSGSHGKNEKVEKEKEQVVRNSGSSREEKVQKQP